MRMDWGWGWGGLGGVGLLGLVLFLVFWGLVIAALVLLIRRLVRSDARTRYDGPPPWDRYTRPPGAVPPPGAAPPPGVVPPAGLGPPGGAPPSGTIPPGVPPAPGAIEVLRQRYARGEIDEAEFERRRAFLEDGRGSAGSSGSGATGGSTAG